MNDPQKNLYTCLLNVCLAKTMWVKGEVTVGKYRCDQYSILINTNLYLAKSTEVCSEMGGLWATIRLDNKKDILLCHLVELLTDSQCLYNSCNTSLHTQTQLYEYYTVVLKLFQ